MVRIKKNEPRPESDSSIRACLVPALLLACLLGGCVADGEDALAMRDENLYEDLADKAKARTGRDYVPEEMGKNLRKWQEEEFKDRDSITLAECFRLALNRNEDLLLQGEQLFEAWTFEREAISGLLPSVSFNWDYTVNSDAVKFSGVTVAPRDTTESWFSAQQTIFDAQAIAAVPAAKAARKIEQLSLHDVRDRLLFSVAAAFYVILGLEHDVRVFETSLTSQEEFYRVVEARRRSGEASRQEALLVQAQRDQIAAQLIESRHNLKIARTGLARLTCLEELPGKLVDTFIVDRRAGDIPALVEEARLKRSDLGAARAAIELAEAVRMAATSDYFPRVYADFTRWTKREGAFSDEVDWDLSLNATWSIFDSGGREARQARALSGIRQRQYNVSSLERQVRQEVEEAVLFFESLERQLSALKSREKASKSALDLAEAEYQADEATNLDVQISRSAWEEASRDLARTELALKLAALRIQLVTGNFNIAEPLMEAVEIAGQ
jgi:outer membrane protein TolC